MGSLTQRFSVQGRAVINIEAGCDHPVTVPLFSNQLQFVLAPVGIDEATAHVAIANTALRSGLCRSHVI